MSNRGVSQKAKDNYTEIFNQVPGEKITGNRGRKSREIEKNSRRFRFEFPQMKLLISTNIILYLIWYSLCTLHLWSAVKMIRRPFAISTTISNTDWQTPSSSREVARRTLVDMPHIPMDRRFTVGDDSNAYITNQLHPCARFWHSQFCCGSIERVKHRYCQFCREFFDTWPGCHAVFGIEKAFDCFMGSWWICTLLS